jgi:hypothetical protein
MWTIAIIDHTIAAALRSVVGSNSDSAARTRQRTASSLRYEVDVMVTSTPFRCTRLTMTEKTSDSFYPYQIPRPGGVGPLDSAEADNIATAYFILMLWVKVKDLHHALNNDRIGSLIVDDVVGITNRLAGIDLANDVRISCTVLAKSVRNIIIASNGMEKLQAVHEALAISENMVKWAKMLIDEAIEDHLIEAVEGYGEDG